MYIYIYISASKGWPWGCENSKELLGGLMFQAFSLGFRDQLHLQKMDPENLQNDFP